MREHFRGALDMLAHHVTAQMVGVVMSDQNLVDFVAFALGQIEDPVDVPCRIDHRRLARGGIADDVDEVGHRAKLAWQM